MSILFLFFLLQQTTITLLATGDINLGRQVGQEILKGDIDFPFRSLSTFLQSADITFGNLESTISDQKGVTRKGTYGFTAPPAAARSLKNGGFDIVSTANNHIWDFGERGYVETLANLDKVGIVHVGTGTDLAQAYKPVVLERQGIRVGFLAVTSISNHGFAPPVGNHVARADINTVSEIIRTMRSSVDFIVVSYHGDAEYTDYPTESQRQFAHRCIDAGADVFLGHHPHVVQGVEWYKNKYIIYSLGNFVFFQNRPWAKRSVLLKLYLTTSGSEKEITAAYFPISCGNQPALADFGEYATIINHLKKISFSPNLENQ